jgi:hypothetical protein
MTSFAEEEDKFDNYNIYSLPEFITESSLFIRTLDMCPSMTEFHYDRNKMVVSLKIKSHEDFEKLIDADQMFGFTSKVQIQLLENMYNFWLDDPNSSQLPLPVNDFSHFGNQVRALFTELNTILPVRCFQGNYVELFDYLLKRDGLSTVDGGRWPDYTLPYYGAVCNNIEIVKRGLEIGVSVADDVIDQAIKQKNLEMFWLLVNNKNVRYTNKTLDIAAKEGSLEMYKHFLGVARGASIISIRRYVLKTLYNKANLEYLLRESDVNLRCVNGLELLQECIREGLSAEIIQLVDIYFSDLDGDTKPLIYKLQEIEGFANIPEKVVYNEDLELFMYLQSKGFLIRPSLIDYVRNTHKSPKFTPGFIKRQYADQEAALERKKQEDDESIENQID